MNMQLHDLLNTPEVPELGPGPRAGVMAEKKLNEELRKIGASDLLRATVLLWHDQLEAAHQIVQSIENAGGSYLHAIMHRREPDYGNSKYWFHRVGAHPCFRELAEKTEVLLGKDSSLYAKLVPKGQWDPFAFVDACAAGYALETQDLRNIQAMELALLGEYFAG
jgi:hypothetical protein